MWIWASAKGNVLYAPWPGVGAVVPERPHLEPELQPQGLCPVKLSLHLLIGGRGMLSSNTQRH